MRVFLIFSVTCLLLAILWTPRTLSQGMRLQKTHNVQLLQSPQRDARPFFRVEFNIVTADGAPAKVSLKNIELKELVKGIEIQEGNNAAYHPFYVTSSNSGAVSAPGRDVLMLIDTSGSMNKTDVGDMHLLRFQAAQAAVRELLQDFRDGVDNISIVPFESHDVNATISNAQFMSTRALAEQQINALPSPKGNTGLYSAEVAALNVLAERRKLDPSRRSLLVILTDGANDVGNEGDDPNLLNEIKPVLDKADEVSIPIYTVGFGNEGEDFDAGVLQQLAYPRSAKNYFLAKNAGQLRDKMRIVQQLMLEAFQITFFDPNHPDTSSLSSITFRVRIQPASGPAVESGDITWTCPYMSSAGCPASVSLTGPEKTALVDSLVPPPKVKNPWYTLLRILGILALFSGGLAFFWFIPPRLMWPRPHLPHVPGRMSVGSLPSISRFARRRPAEQEPPTPRRAGPQPSPTLRRRLDETQVMPKGSRDR